MSLAELYNFPQPNDRPSFELWAFANADSHRQIIAAVQRQRSVILMSWPLWPFDPTELDTFLLRHQQTHNQMDATLGLQQNDFTDINPEDRESFEQVLYLHAEDHRKAHEVLGI